jgi:hypothetical protein
MTSRIAKPEELAADEVLVAAALRSPAGSPMATLRRGPYQPWAIAFAESALRAAGTRIELDGHLTAWPLALGPLETEARGALISTVSRPAQLTATRVDTAAERLDFDVDKLGGLVSYLARLQAARLVDEAAMKAAHDLHDDALTEALTGAPAPAPAQTRHAEVTKVLMDAGMPAKDAPNIANTLLSKITESVILEMVKAGGGTIPEFLADLAGHPSVRLPPHPAVRAGATNVIRALLNALIAREIIDEIKISGKGGPESKFITAQPINYLSDAALAEAAHRILHSLSGQPTAIGTQGSRVIQEVRRRAADYVPGSDFTDAVAILMLAARGNLTPERIARYYIEGRADRASLEAAVAAGQVSREVLTLVKEAERQ